MKDVRNNEMSYYMTKMQSYGLPLDSRGDLCKSDWQMWVMGFADLQSQRNTLINTLWKYINETKSRVPVSDNHNVKSGSQAMFQARSVVGGYWMRVFVNQFSQDVYTGIESPSSQFSPEWESETFDLSGRKVNSNSEIKKGIYIKNGKKVLY